MPDLVFSILDVVRPVLMQTSMKARERSQADDDLWHGRAPVHVVRAQATVQVDDQAEETLALKRDRYPWRDGFPSAPAQCHINRPERGWLRAKMISPALIIRYGV
ncbi:hypothetical protein shn_34055 (plasmid) [Shinella sp. HZN7]|nr:hypothetical protein shn_34055 [Shinella sp. HZN7]